jgi:hypothetical protein
MEGGVLDHVVAAVEQAPLQVDPFAHSYVEHVFPEDVYEELLSSLPEPQLFEPLYHSSRVSPSRSSSSPCTTRMRCSRTAGRRAPRSRSTQPTWRPFLPGSEASWSESRR